MSFNAADDYISFQIPDLESFFNQILEPVALERAMAAALDEIENQLKNNFQTHQQTWRRLAVATQRQRRYLGYNPTSPILVRSETLLNNVAKGKEIQITNNELRGDVYPNDDTRAPYSKVDLGEYIEQLNKVREFYSLDEHQFDIVTATFVDTLSKELGLM